MLIIFIPWFLKACADAIVFGKGGERTYFLWHAISWLSYAIPGSYIAYLTHNFTIGFIFATLVICRPIFEIVYHILRNFDVYKLDNKMKWFWK